MTIAPHNQTSCYQLYSSPCTHQIRPSTHSLAKTTATVIPFSGEIAQALRRGTAAPAESFVSQVHDVWCKGEEGGSTRSVHLCGRETAWMPHVARIGIG